MKVTGDIVWFLKTPEGKWLFNEEYKAIEKIEDSSHDPEDINLQTFVFKEEEIEIKGISWKDIAVKLMEGG